MNMKQLKYVIVLAQSGSFSKAADILNISQPSLSQYIKKIENEVGLELFDRANGDVRLTDAGSVYLDVGRKILDLEHQMEMKFFDLASHKTGSITIGMAPFRCAGIMPAVIRRFKEKYPDVTVVIDEKTTAELLEGAEHGEYDLCLMTLPVNEKIFAYEEVMQEELLLAVPCEYPDLPCSEIRNRKYPAIDASIINGGNFVMLSETQVMQHMLNELCDEHDLVLKRSVSVKNIESQINMVREGLGMALVPSGIEVFCGENEVRFYSFIQELPRRKIVAMYRRDRELSVVAKDMLELIKQI